jgi:NAD(P)-dependent dehydrogenase (short-subunit alcohol dehydrogenase family)
MNKYLLLNDFTGKRVVVTGGTGLLGTEIVKCFSAYNAITLIADINESAAKKLIKEIRENNKKAEYVYLDISKISEIPNNISKIEKSFGPIDIWVNNAYPRTDDWPNKLEDIRIESWQKNIDMHLNSYCICSNEIAKRMAKRKKGVIINIGSIHSFVSPDLSLYEGTEMTSPAAYTAIKGGILMYSKYLSSYYGKDNIRVNVVCPGGIVNNQPKEFIEKYNAKTLLKRMAKPEEVAPSVIFLASEGASYITGTTLIVDGGFTAT